MPESGLPIRVWQQDDQWHVDYSDGVVEDFQNEEEATSAADARPGRVRRRVLARRVRAVLLE
jgi:hypothetical protein